MKKSGMFILSLILLLGVSLFASASYQVCSSGTGGCAIINSLDGATYNWTVLSGCEAHDSNSNIGYLVTVTTMCKSFSSFNLKEGSFEWYMHMDNMFNNGCGSNNFQGTITFADGQKITEKHCNAPTDDRYGLWTGTLTVTKLLDWYKDSDGDGYGNLTSTTSSVTQPTGYVSNSNDCDDSNPTYTTSCPTKKVCSSESQTIFRTYQTMNSHIGLWNNNNYNSPACYDEIFVGKLGNGDRACKTDGSNTLFYKYQEDNSHVSSVKTAEYAIPVCYGDLSCSAKASCATGEVVLASLYQQTNSHISLGNDANYPIKICCSSGANYIDASKTSLLNWSNSVGEIITSASNDTHVNLTIMGNFSAGQKFDYKIWLKDIKYSWYTAYLIPEEDNKLVESGSHIISSNEAIMNKSSETSWLAIWKPSYNVDSKYYFEIITPTLSKNSGNLDVSSSILNVTTRTKVTNPINGQIYFPNENISLAWKITVQNSPVKQIRFVGGEGAKINGNSDQFTAYGLQDDLLNLKLNISYSTPGQKKITLYTTDSFDNVWASKVEISVAKEGLNAFANISKPEDSISISAIEGKVQISANGSYVYNLTKTNGVNSIKCVLGNCPLQTSGETKVDIAELSDIALKSLKSSKAIFNWSWSDSTITVNGNGLEEKIIDFEYPHTSRGDKVANLKFSYLDSSSQTSNSYYLLTLGLFCNENKQMQTENPLTRSLTILGVLDYDCRVLKVGCCGETENCNPINGKCEVPVTPIITPRITCADFNVSEADCEINTKNKGIANFTLYNTVTLPSNPTKKYSCGEIVVSNKSYFEQINESCGCVWDNNECKLNWKLIKYNSGKAGNVGGCLTTQGTSSGSCETTGTLTFSWVANWIYAPGMTAEDDTSKLHEACVSGQNVIPCPAQLKLPFFGIFGFVAVLGIIALVYIFRRE